MKPHIIIGPADSDGVSLAYGPFATDEQAVEWASQALPSGKWRYGQIQQPSTNWVITDAEGCILEHFLTQQERDDALLTGEYPDDAEPAYVSDPT